MTANEVGALINYSLELYVELQRVGTIIATAQAEGRQQLTAAEKAAIKQDRAAAFERLEKAIEDAQARGR